jgi:hypothetical protein
MAAMARRAAMPDLASLPHDEEVLWMPSRERWECQFPPNEGRGLARKINEIEVLRQAGRPNFKGPELTSTPKLPT